MARFLDRVNCAVSGTPGTATVTVGAAASGFRTPVAAGGANGDVVPFVFIDGSAWELSYCTLSSTATVLTRSLVRSSTGSLLNLTSAATFFGSPFSDNMPQSAHFRQELAQGVGPTDAPGGGSWSGRALNTTVANEIPGASLSSGNIVLPPGTYEVVASASANAPTTAVLAGRLYNVTDSTVALRGPAMRSDSAAASIMGTTPVTGRFTITATKTMRFEQMATAGASPSGGAVLNAGIEVYVDVLIRKIA